MDPVSIDVLVVFAVREESQHFKASACKNLKVQAAILGMGKENARRRFKLALERVKPKYVITSGFAGALGWDLPPGRIIYEGDVTETLQELLQDAGARAGSFYCAERVAVTAAEKHMLYLDHRCDAVEMESGVVRDICLERGIPSVTVRVISDAADEDLPVDFNQVMNEKCELDLRELAGSLLRSPSRLPKLLMFQRRIAAVGKNLGKVLTRLMDNPAFPAAVEKAEIVKVVKPTFESDGYEILPPDNLPPLDPHPTDEDYPTSSAETATEPTKH